MIPLCTEGSGMGVNPAVILHYTSLLILSTFMVEVRVEEERRVGDEGRRGGSEGRKGRV